MTSFQTGNNMVRKLTPAEALAFGQPEAAESELKSILQKQHDNLEAQLELIKLYLYQGLFDKARQEIVKARKQWPGNSRLNGLGKCADRQERKHKKKSGGVPSGYDEVIGTSDKVFHIVRFIFCILLAAASFSIFYYYFYYLDSSSGASGSRGILSMPIGTIALHALFYVLLLALVFTGFKNFFQFLFLPDAVGVGKEGIFLKSKIQKKSLTWDSLANLTYQTHHHHYPKEHLTTFQHSLRITPEKSMNFLTLGFLLNIPQTGIGQFQNILKSVRTYRQVKEEKLDSRSGFGVDFF